MFHILNSCGVWSLFCGMWNVECGMRYDFKNKWFDNDYFISVLFSFHIPHSTFHIPQLCKLQKII